MQDFLSLSGEEDINTLSGEFGVQCAATRQDVKISVGRIGEHGSG